MHETWSDCSLQLPCLTAPCFSDGLNVSTTVSSLRKVQEQRARCVTDETSLFSQPKAITPFQASQKYSLEKHHLGCILGWFFVLFFHMTVSLMYPLSHDGFRCIQIILPLCVQGPAGAACRTTPARRFHDKPSLARVGALCHAICFLCQGRCGLLPLGLLPVCRCWRWSPGWKFCWLHFDCYPSQ